MEKYLPIGTVVSLNDIHKRFMIIGLVQTVYENNSETTYDYSACLFPEGIIETDKSYLFNHDQIDKIFYYGLIDDEQKEFLKYLDEEMKNEIEMPNLTDFHKDNIEIFNIN